MPPKIYKLKSEADFNKVYRYGRRKVFPLFVLRFFFNPKLITRVAVVASIKEVGKSTKRNRAKRRLWSALNKAIIKLPKKGFLLVFNAKKEVLMAKWADVRQNIESSIDNMANISRYKH